MLGRIKQTLTTNQLARNISAMVSGNAAARAVGILALPAITRLYSPSDFGDLAVFVSVLSILLPFVTLRYSVAMPLPRYDASAANLVALCVVLTVLFTLLASVTIGFLTLNPAVFGLGSFDPYWWAIVICVLGAGVYEILSAWATRTGRLSPVAKTMVYQSIGSAGTKILLGLIGMKPLGLIVGHTVGVTAGSLTLTKEFGRDIRASLNRVSVKRIRLVAARYADFPKFRLPSQFLLAFAAQMPILFSAWIFGDATTGQLSLALIVVGLPITLLGKAVGQSLYAEIASLGVDRAPEIKELCFSFEGSSITTLPSIILQVFPSASIIPKWIWTSNRSMGKFSIVTLSLVSRLAAISFRTLFLAPDISTLPSNRDFETE